MAHTGHTPPFRTESGEIVPGSIAEVDFHRIGGVDQWVMIRGERVANPLLVFLHGGPGFSETRFLRHHNAALERHFTIVYWDQRGAGKSYRKDIPRASMTAEQFIADLDELMAIARQRTGQTRAAIFGHSWGTVLGVLYAARFPDKVGAYVGSGQIGSWPEAEAKSYAIALEEAERRGDGKALKQLRAIGPPPYDAEALWTERNILQRFAGAFSPRSLWEMGRTILSGPEWSLADLPGMMTGFRFSLDAMWESVSPIDLNEAVPKLEMPVFFLLGRHDKWVPPETSVAYLERLEAPAKDLVWFDGSGHEPFVDEPARFNATMVERVLPVLS